jgi:transposase-like protein
MGYFIYGLIAAMVLVIGAFVFSAIRQTRAELDRKIGGGDAEDRRRKAEAMLAHVRNLAVDCEQCGQPADMVVGTGNRYRCDNCGREFTAEPHFPDESD